jgi:hypothetical protein
MAQNPFPEAWSMEQNAMGRAREMRRRVPKSADSRLPIPLQPVSSPHSGNAHQEQGRESQKQTPLSFLDGDSLLILALMYMLYKDRGWEDCDKKLLLALAYLL